MRIDYDWFSSKIRKWCPPASSWRPGRISGEIITKSKEPAQKDIDQLWAKEAEKRVKEYEEGKIEAIEGEQVFNEIRDHNTES